MSNCRDFGKDKVVFVTREDHESDSKYILPPDDEPRGLILPNGDINWSCPCIGGTASGPCAFEFREAFSCFHNSKSETKGSECVEKFTALNNCMSEFPTLYKRDPEPELDLDSFDKDRLDPDLKALEEKRISQESKSKQDEQSNN